MLNKSSPKVSVILPIYKEPIEYIKSSIESILNQTFEDFELILIIDTGKDSPEFEEIYESIVAMQEQDNRIDILINEKNIGLPASLNLGVRTARGRYIARMDGDDIALPYRLQTQFEYMEKNKHVDLCGGKVYYINRDGVVIGESEYLDEKTIFIRLHAGRLTIPHSTWFLRKSVFEDIGLYKNLYGIEDYEFLCRMVLNKKRMALIDDFVLRYRLTYTKNRISSKRLRQLRNTFIVRDALRQGREIQEEEILKASEKEPGNILVFLDGISQYLENLAQLKLPWAYPYLRWPIRAISPYKLKQILEAIVIQHQLKLKQHENLVK